MPKLPEILGKEVVCSSNTLPNLLDTNPFFFEWVFCSNLGSKDVPAQLKDMPGNVLDSFQSARVRLAELIHDCLIIKYSIIQYKLLKGEFAAIEKEYKESLKIIENCFQVATVYWQVVKRYLTENSFRQPYHEAYFFKVVKPAFTCEIDFLALAYHALLSKAANKDSAFWEKERQRKKKLLLEYPDFFTYYFNGSTENDDIWFTRTTQVDYSSHDHIVSSWFAINRYDTFIDRNIESKQNAFKLE